MGLLRRCVFMGVLLAGCQRGPQICPNGTTIDKTRSKDGAFAWCKSDDGKILYWVELQGVTDLRQICTFKEGRPEGTFRAFHPNGARWIEGLFAQGLRDGPWQQWDSGGRLVAEGTYRRGVLIAGAPVAIAAKCDTVKP
jgi:antitoxin component YwqK of YwqJK toxin-antitoxin module